jgi:hypothetical protein
MAVVFGVLAAISLKSLSLWNCTKVGDVYYLTNDLRLKCTGSAYVAASVFNVLFVLVVVFGWPAFLIWFDFKFFLLLRIFHITQWHLFSLLSLILIACQVFATREISKQTGP